MGEKISELNPIKVFPDGDQWCALVGEDLQTGHAAFGDTPEEAIAQLFAVSITQIGSDWVVR